MKEFSVCSGLVWYHSLYKVYPKAYGIYTISANEFLFCNWIYCSVISDTITSFSEIGDKKIGKTSVMSSYGRIIAHTFKHNEKKNNKNTVVDYGIIELSKLNFVTSMKQIGER